MQGYAGDKYASQVGEGHISILPWHYSAVVAGTWVWTANSSQYMYGYWKNTSNAQNDQLDYKIYLDAGTYTFVVLGVVNTNNAILTMYLDDVSQGTQDWYGAITYNQIKSITNIVVATPGIKKVSIKAATRNGSSTGWYLLLNSFTFYRTA